MPDTHTRTIDDIFAAKSPVFITLFALGISYYGVGYGNSDFTIFNIIVLGLIFALLRIVFRKLRWSTIAAIIVSGLVTYIVVNYTFRFSEDGVSIFYLFMKIPYFLVLFIAALFSDQGKTTFNTCVNGGIITLALVEKYWSVTNLMRNIDLNQPRVALGTIETIGVFFLGCVIIHALRIVTERRYLNASIKRMIIQWVGLIAFLGMGLSVISVFNNVLIKDKGVYLHNESFEIEPGRSLSTNVALFKDAEIKYEFTVLNGPAVDITCQLQLLDKKFTKVLVPELSANNVRVFQKQMLLAAGQYMVSIKATGTDDNTNIAKEKVKLKFVVFQKGAR